MEEKKKLSAIITKYFPFVENSWHLNDAKLINAILEANFIYLFGTNEFILNGDHKNLSISKEDDDLFDILITYNSENYRLYSEKGEIYMINIKTKEILFHFFARGEEKRIIVNMQNNKNKIIVKELEMNSKDQDLVAKYYVLDENNRDDGKYTLEFIKTRLGRNYYFKIVTPYGDGVKEITSSSLEDETNYDDVLSYTKEMFDILEEARKNDKLVKR